MSNFSITEIMIEIQSLAQSGLAYCKDVYDKERYNRLLELSAKLGDLISKVDYQEIFELFSKDTGYATPKIDVRGAVFKDHRILLVREKSDNLWSLPGGWADVNHSPAENILKEIREETGYECKVIKLIGIYDKNKSNPPPQWPHVYKLFFLCEIIGYLYANASNIEISEMNFFDLYNLPKLSGRRVNQQQIEDCFRHLNNSKINTQFE